MDQNMVHVEVLTLSLNPSVTMHHEDIKAAIRKKGVNQAQIARHLKVSEMLVSSVIAGKNKSARVAKAISKIVGVPVDELWPDTYAKKPAHKRVAELLG